MFWASLLCLVIALIFVALMIGMAVMSLKGLDPEEWE